MGIRNRKINEHTSLRVKGEKYDAYYLFPTVRRYRFPPETALFSFLDQSLFERHRFEFFLNGFATPPQLLPVESDEEVVLGGAGERSEAAQPDLVASVGLHRRPRPVRVHRVHGGPPLGHLGGVVLVRLIRGVAQHQVVLQKRRKKGDTTVKQVIISEEKQFQFLGTVQSSPWLE